MEHVLEQEKDPHSRGHCKQIDKRFALPAVKQNNRENNNYSRNKSDIDSQRYIGTEKQDKNDTRLLLLPVKFKNFLFFKYKALDYQRRGTNQRTRQAGTRKSLVKVAP